MARIKNEELLTGEVKNSEPLRDLTQRQYFRIVKLPEQRYALETTTMVGDEVVDVKESDENSFTITFDYLKRAIWESMK